MIDVVKLSIVICTYNNANSLAKTLSDLNQCVAYIPEQIELLIVDNNSSDDTPDVYNKLVKASPFFTTYLFEEKQGLSHARNLGLNSARGEYILFTDDDASIPTNWMQLYVDKISETNAKCLYSKIFIQWDRTIPDWYIPEYQPLLVHLDYGDQQLEVDDIHHEFFGKNFCVERSFLVNLGGFDPKLGRCGDRLIAGEETLIYKKLISTKSKVVYFPEAEVGHRLKEREYSIDNIKKLFSDSCYSEYHIPKITTNKKLMGRPLYPLKSNILDMLPNLAKLTKSKAQGNEPYTVYYRLKLVKNIKIIWLWCINP